MDSSRILVALQERDKWKDRRTRLEDRLQSVRARKRFLQRELDDVRRKVARLEAAVFSLQDHRLPRDEPISSMERIR